LPLTQTQLHNLKNNTITIQLLQQNGLDKEYYIEPLRYIEEELHHTLTCTGQEYRHAVEIANDEDITPTSHIKIIVDGILAIIYADKLQEVGLDLLTYFRYRFNPPQEIIDKLKQFEKQYIKTIKN
jgi:hypothetical protein